MRINPISTQYQTFAKQNKNRADYKEGINLSDIKLGYDDKPKAPKKTPFVDKIPVVRNIYHVFFGQEEYLMNMTENNWKIYIECKHI